MEKFALYIHVPFCRPGKCMYCEFYSVPYAQARAEKYLSAVKREIDLAPAEYAGAKISSVFFGGGTPSLLEPEAVGNLLDRVRAAWEFEPECGNQPGGEPGGCFSGPGKGLAEGRGEPPLRGLPEF